MLPVQQGVQGGPGEARCTQGGQGWQVRAPGHGRPTPWGPVYRSPPSGRDNPSSLRLKVLGPPIGRPSQGSRGASGQQSWPPPPLLRIESRYIGHERPATSSLHCPSGQPGGILNRLRANGPWSSSFGVAYHGLKGHGPLQRPFIPSRLLAPNSTELGFPVQIR